MLKNATTLAIVAVHTAENEPLKIWGDLFSLFSSLLIEFPKLRELKAVGALSCRDLALAFLGLRAVTELMDVPR